MSKTSSTSSADCIKDKGMHDYHVASTDRGKTVLYCRQCGEMIPVGISDEE